jgi:hypothetical protein
VKCLRLSLLHSVRLRHSINIGYCLHASKDVCVGSEVSVSEYTERCIRRELLSREGLEAHDEVFEYALDPVWELLSLTV